MNPTIIRKHYDQCVIAGLHSDLERDLELKQMLPSLRAGLAHGW